MLKSLKVMLLSCVLLACSANPVGLITDVLKPDKGIHVETEVVAGDKQESVEVGNTLQEAQTITNINEVPMGVMFLLALGWFLPGPDAVFRGIRKWNAKT